MLRPILSYLLVLIQLSSVSANTKLRLVYVPKRLLDSSMKDTFQTVSENVCGIIASRLEWAKLACFQKGSCDIYSNAFLPNSNADDVLNPIKCFTLVDKNGKLILKKLIFLLKLKQTIISIKIRDVFLSTLL